MLRKTITNREEATVVEYRAELPWNTSMETITALREVGAVRLVFEVEADSRRSAIHDLTAGYEWRGLDRDWWDRHISGRRGAKPLRQN